MGNRLKWWEISLITDRSKHEYIEKMIKHEPLYKLHDGTIRRREGTVVAHWEKDKYKGEV